MAKDDFYIGYQDKAPDSIMKFIKSRVWILAIVVLVAGLGFSLGQQKFGNGSFELGKLTEVEGVLHLNPYPVLKVEIAPNEFKELLLLGFGKFGAENGLMQIAGEEAIDGLRIKLEGTLIYYDGVTLMQLEPELDGTYEVLGRSTMRLESSSMGTVSLQGEVIDPKCYFGVMKPGRGKIHRSCAVRCISGGIPPVFVSTNEDGSSSFLLITNEDGEAANQDVLDIIGKPCAISGELMQTGQWTILKMESDKIVDLGTKSSVY